MGSYNIYRLGDQAFTIALGDTITEAVNEHCISLQQYIIDAHLTGVKEVSAAYHTVTVRYDAFAIHQHHHTNVPGQWLKDQLTQLLPHVQPSSAKTHRTLDVPACFDASCAPDLATLAASKHMTIESVIDAFTSKSYRVYMMGFLPGFPYMALVPDSISAPRKQHPSMTQPGSIGIAGVQTGIYPLASPGGWNIIGRTPWRIFNPAADAPNIFQAGDQVRFFAIDMQTFNEQNQHR